MSNDFKEVCDHLKSSIRSLEDAIESFEAVDSRYETLTGRMDDEYYMDMIETLRTLKVTRSSLKER